MNALGDGENDGSRLSDHEVDLTMLRDFVSTVSLAPRELRQEILVDFVPNCFDRWMRKRRESLRKRVIGL